MRKVVSKISIVSAVVLSVFMGSCFNNEREGIFDSEETNSYKTEEDLERAFGAVESITNAGMNYANENSSGRIAENGELACATIEFEGTQDQGIVVIDYGASGCQGPDGRIRRGKVIIEYNGRRVFFGSVVYTELENFYLDDLKIEGILKSENISKELSSPKFKITVSNGKIVWPDESYTTWVLNRFHEWEFSSDLSEVKLTVTGSSSGWTRFFKNFSCEIVEPLVFNGGCFLQGNYIPSEGKKLIDLEDFDNIVIDYGTGDCDREITVTIGEKTNQALL